MQVIILSISILFLVIAYFAPFEIVLEEEQDYIDTAYSAREFRRGNRYSGKANISSALSKPVNTLAGGRLQNLRELGDITESVCFANFTKED